VFEYVYDHVYSNAWLFPEFGLPEICEEMACHCEEIPFVCVEKRRLNCL